MPSICAALARGIFVNEVTRNGWLWGALGPLHHAAVRAALPAACAHLLQLAPLNAAMWVLVLACSLAPFVATQAIMAVVGRRHARPAMTATLLPWLKFAVCTALIGLAGPALTRYGDVIARLTGFSRSWVGLVLLATATSLPELFTGISAVTVADAPNIAVGDALGSCVFNLVMLVLLDELSREEPMYRRIDQGHILTAGFGVILIGAAGAFLLLSQNALGFQVLHISGYTPFIIVIYFVAMRAAFIYERRMRPPPEFAEVKARHLLAQCCVCVMPAPPSVVVVAGSWLPFVGQEIAQTMGWKTTFVGTLFIAGATSVPEFVVTVSALGSAPST